MALRFRLCVGGLRGGEHVPGSARALACPHRRIADVRGGPGRSMLLRLWASWLLSGQAGSLRMNQRLCDMPARSDDRRGRRSLHARRVRSPEVDGGVLAFSTRDRPTGNLSNQHSSFTSSKPRKSRIVTPVRINSHVSCSRNFTTASSSVGSTTHSLPDPSPAKA